MTITTSDRGDFPKTLPDSDRERWARMTPGQREKAQARLAAFRSWIGGEVGMDAAIELTGLSRSRFYRLVADWRVAPSLASLGALTGSGAARARLDPEVVNALQAKVADVVRLNAGASVSQLARHLVDASGLGDDRLPGAVKLREIVEAELRRVAATHEAGHAVQFDCSAINLPQGDGRPYILFACVDAGTGLILGSAIGASPDVEGGYRAVAADARTRIADALAPVPWSQRLARAEMTAGADLDRSVALVERLVTGGVRANLQLARVPRRYGRYLRKVVGARIGRVEMTPARTESGQALPDNADMMPWSAAEAAAAVTGAVDDHNAALVSVLARGASGRPPEDLDLLLSLLALGR